MIKSMTGFGRCEIADEKRKFTVELKSVNHRYLDVNMKMPKKLNFFESAIRSLLKKYIERGKVDLYISYEDYTEDNYALKYNEGLAGEYLKYLNAMAETFHLENDVPPNLKYPSMNHCPVIRMSLLWKNRKWTKKSSGMDCRRQSAEHVNNSLRPVSGKART